jgi:hypothetical protein
MEAGGGADEVRVCEVIRAVDGRFPDDEAATLRACDGRTKELNFTM